MLRLIVDRLLQMIVVIFCVTLACFVLVNLLEGDIVYALLGENATPDAIAQLTKELRLDDPLLVRYFAWLGSVLSGDFGTSLITHQPVGQALRSAVPPTVELMIGAQVVALTLAMVSAALSVRVRWVDRLMTGIALVANAVPPFVVSLLLIVVFSTTFHLLPSVGWVEPARGGWGANIEGMLMPWFALGLSIFPEYMRVLRSDLQDQLDREEYVLLARMKGLSGRRVLARHVVPNSVGGLISLVAMTTGFLLSGVVIVEEVFAIPGLGKLTYNAINDRDATMLEGAIIVIAVAVVVANLLGELLHMRIDPRVRQEQEVH